MSSQSEPVYLGVENCKRLNYFLACLGSRYLSLLNGILETWITPAGSCVCAGQGFRQAFSCHVFPTVFFSSLNRYLLSVLLQQFQWRQCFFFPQENKEVNWLTLLGSPKLQHPSRMSNWKKDILTLPLTRPAIQGWNKFCVIPVQWTIIPLSSKARKCSTFILFGQADVQERSPMMAGACSFRSL